MTSVECFIEGSDTAKPLYEKFGFSTVPDEWIVVPVPEKWKERPEVGCYFYERPARAAEVPNRFPT